MDGFRNGEWRRMDFSTQTRISPNARLGKIIDLILNRLMPKSEVQKTEDPSSPNFPLVEDSL
jgi:hypothetical protein